MKTFSQFICEARDTLASQQARQMGLQSNSHGDYYDSEGKLVAKTIKGKLQVFKGRQKKNLESQKSPAPTPQPVQQTPQVEPPVQQDQTQGQQQIKGIVVTLGRFNPPANGHENMMKAGNSLAIQNNYEYRIYPSRVQDSGSNPLNPSLKVQYMQMMYPKYADYILDSEDMKTIFDILESLSSDGFNDVRIMVGSERLGEFQSLVHQNQGQAYQFDNIEVLPSPGKDPDSDMGGAGTSAALRIAASENNFEQFSSNLPRAMRREDKEQLFNSVLKSMKLGEGYELWRIAPELDRESLRRNYKENNLYPIGSIVENINTGLQGKVIRRGTNYLICLTDEGVMFKNWLTSVHLPEDVYEVGTDKYRKKLQEITPGQPVGSFTGIKIKETVPKNLNTIRQRLFGKK